MITISQCEDFYNNGFLYKSEDENLVLYTYSDKCTYEKHWNEVTMQCRGLIFDKATGDIVAKPFPKFFNLGETEETKLTNLPDLPYEVIDKLDGSLGIIYYYGGEWRVATKGSLNSEQAKEAAKILNEKYCMDGVVTFTTILVEIIYPSNRIVVNYSDKRELVLLGAIDRTSPYDEYYQDLGYISYKTGIPLAKRYNHKLDELETIAETLPISNEGFVIRFSNGLRVKVKGKEYLAIHKIKSYLNPLSLWGIMTNGKVDKDFLSKLPDEFHDDANVISDKLEFNYLNEYNVIENLASSIPFTFDGTPESRKQLGLYIQGKDDLYRILFPFFLGQKDKVDAWIMKSIKPSGNILIV